MESSTLVNQKESVSDAVTLDANVLQAALASKQNRRGKCGKPTKAEKFGLQLNLQLVNTPDAHPSAVTPTQTEDPEGQMHNKSNSPPKLHLALNALTLGPTAQSATILPASCNSKWRAQGVKDKNKDEDDEEEEEEEEALLHDGPANLVDEVHCLKKVGKGAGGVVSLGCYLPVLKLVAVKDITVHDEQDKRMIAHELHAMHENMIPIQKTSTEEQSTPFTWLFHHHSNIGSSHPCPYIVSYYGSFLAHAKPTVSLVMEYMDGGSLQEFLDNKQILHETHLQHIAYSCMRALAHMHEFRMIHRDIKPANILINGLGQVKVADFGLAVTLSKSKSYFSDFKGTMMYMAPERIQGQHYSYPSDIWSVGLVLLSLALGRFPFEKADGFFALEDDIVNGKIPQPHGFSSTFHDFLNQVLEKNPLQRSTAIDALRHPFFHHYSEKHGAQTFAEIVHRATALLEDQHLQALSYAALVRKRDRDLMQKIRSVGNIFHPSSHGNYYTTSQYARRFLKALANDTGLPLSLIQQAFDQELARMNAPEESNTSPSSHHRERRLGFNKYSLV